MEAVSPVEPLAAAHETSGFDCGRVELNEFLDRHALANQRGGGARTFVVHRGSRVVGYYSLSAGAITHESSTERVRSGQGRYSIPVVVLARLAVDAVEQGRGLGSALLKDALRRIAAVAEDVGVRAVLVNAKDDQATGFYQRFEFEPSPTGPSTLLLLMKDLRALLGL